MRRLAALAALSLLGFSSSAAAPVPSSNALALEVLAPALAQSVPPSQEVPSHWQEPTCDLGAAPFADSIALGNQDETSAGEHAPAPEHWLDAPWQRQATLVRRQEASSSAASTTARSAATSEAAEETSAGTSTTRRTSSGTRSASTTGSTTKSTRSSATRARSASEASTTATSRESDASSVATSTSRRTSSTGERTSSERSGTSTSRTSTTDQDESTSTTTRADESSSTSGRQSTTSDTTTTTTPTTVTATSETTSASSRASSTSRRTTAASSTRTSAASASATCVPAPETFDGTDAGFAALCRSDGSASYCSSNPKLVLNGRDLRWSGNSGRVTRDEVEGSLAMLQAIDPIWEMDDDVGNSLSMGMFGQSAYAASVLFEVSGDRRALNEALRFADNLLFLRNDPENGLVFWTGEREPVWRTKEEGSTNLTYAGSEQGDIVGHMVQPAIYILKSPCLWDQVPPPYPDTPTVFNSSETYLARALTLIRAGDETVEQFFLPHFLTSDDTLIQPDDERWLQVGDGSNLPGEAMPWNRRFLTLHAFFRLATAHEADVAYDPVKSWRYDAIIRRNVVDFTASLESSMAKGEQTFIWNYVDEKEWVEEVDGVHGYFDTFGVWTAWQRNRKYFNMTDDLLVGLANTMVFQISLGNDTFSGRVDGTTTSKAEESKVLWGGWSYYAYFVPGWYEMIVDANVATGYAGRPWLVIPLLWTKNARSMRSQAFWEGFWSRGSGFVGDTADISSWDRPVQRLVSVQAAAEVRMNADVVHYFASDARSSSPRLSLVALLLLLLAHLSIFVL